MALDVTISLTQLDGLAFPSLDGLAFYVFVAK
jgi:hypothetical protein